MGEYAKYRGESIKIGTCESMYYLRADQARLVTAESGSVDPIRDRAEIRFRFPFPDEDAIEPGHFDYSRGVKIPGWNLPTDWQTHSSIQFKADPGYLLSIPCPEGNEDRDHYHGIRIGRNGFSGGGAKIVQQVWHGDILATVVECGSCGSAWRIPSLDEHAVAIIEAFRTAAESEEWRRLSSDWDNERGCWGDSCNYGFEPTHGETHRAFLRSMADRIEAGYLGLDADEAGLTASGSRS